jgi:hypothetical protein
MGIYKNFQQWAKKEKVTLKMLRQCVDELEEGLFDAQLGNGLYKKRLPKPAEGKRGGYRIILAFRNENRTFFLHGFAKNKIANMSQVEKALYKKLATFFLEASVKEVNQLKKLGKLIEV